MKTAKHIRSDTPFFCGLGTMLFIYLGLVLALVFANFSVVSWSDITRVLADPDVQASIRLTFISCSITAILAVIVAVPVGYLLSRFKFRGRGLVDSVLDIPIVLPPLVVGLSLLILFNKINWGGTSMENWLNDHGLSVTFSVFAVVLAQFSVATAFAIRLVKNTFDQIDRRAEDVALTLGCNRAGTFWRIALPQAGQGVVAAGVLAWARALGEFGPILVFAGATRGRTEVMATSVFLEINMGNLSGAAAISLLMIALALGLIFLIRWLTGGRI